MEPTFPLFRLPKNVILEVIKNLWIGSLYEFSLISTKTKNIVASLGIKSRSVCITISRVVDVTVYCRTRNMRFVFYNDSVDQTALIHLDSNQPISAHSLIRRRTVRSSTPFNFNNWVDHIMTVFSYNKPPDVVFLPGNERYEVESLKNAIKSVNQLYVSEDNTELRNREIFEHFKNANELTLGRNPFEEACEVQKCFIQNFKSIRFEGFVSLDDMLLINSERIELSRPISQNQFNQFLKHWIRGSNPRLERMSLQIDATDLGNGEIYLKGIRCMEMSEDARTEICEKHRLLVSLDMIKIRRKDGTNAVIDTHKSVNTLCVSFRVLH